MLMRLVLVAALLFSGSGVAGARAAASLARTATSVSAATPAPSVDTTAASSGDVSMTEHDVVVPAVEPTGRVVESPDVVAAQHDDRSIVADKVVKADRIESAVVQTDTFQTLGVTWPKDAQIDDLAAQVRTRAGDKWSDWVPLVASDGGPDVNSPDATHHGRGGTDSVWVGDADAVQLSFAATAGGGPDGLTLVLIGSDKPAAPSAASTPSAEGSAATFVTAAYRTAPLRTGIAAPRVISRSEWGAQDPVCTPDVASKLVGAVVHHTAGSNAYSTVAEAEQQIRNDQNYHINGRGWCDIGYNFIVDKWGNIYEGRANSLTEAVIGVHAGGFNTGTVGVAMLGTYTAAPSAATQQAVGQIIGWRLGAYGVDPQGQMDYYTGTGENSRYSNEWVSLPRVMGHRDVAYTACPGDGGYAALPTIRSLAAAYRSSIAFADAQSLVRALYVDLLGREAEPDGLASWSSLVVQGASSAQLVGVLASSEEYRRLRVAQAYRQVLGREPDEAGLSGWVAAIRDGAMSVDDVARLFYESPEFYALAGNDDVRFVSRLYEAMLGREASASEVEFWRGNLATMGRGGVAFTVWFSMEAAQMRAGAYYAQFLGREPEWSGRVYWAQSMLAQGEGAVRVGIAGSTEYWNRAITRYPAGPSS
jgi:hypothetical protein